MIDIKKQITHWHNSAEEDWHVACHLLDYGNLRHGLFFLHLTIEKALKALVCRQTQDFAPRSHNLVRLAEMADLELLSGMLDTLADLNLFNIEGRYPDLYLPLPSAIEAEAYRKQAEELFQWLTEKLSE